MRLKGKNAMNRVLAILLAVLMLTASMPMQVFAAEGSTLTTDIGEKSFRIGQYTEFSFTTTPNDDLNEIVRGYFSVTDENGQDAKTAIDSLQYKEYPSGNWLEFYGPFGPATGFPMTQATSNFKVKFNKAGKYTVKAAMKSVDETVTYCEVEKTIEVVRVGAQLVADLGTFVVGEEKEFTFSTVANDDQGVMVIGMSDFSDPDALESLYYYEVQTQQWLPLDGKFGPTEGFPLSDATSRFKATFKEGKAGTYTFNASINKAEGTQEEVCKTAVTFTVLDKFLVKATANEGGTVRLNGNDADSVIVVQGEKAKIDVVPNTGYQIGSITVNGVPQSISDYSCFESEITVTADTEVKVDFVKTYSVTVTFNENGTVVTTPESSNNVVTVVNGEKVTLVATPAENYRVSKVIVNGTETEVFNDNTYVTGNPYTKDITVDEDKTVEIVFADTVFTITVDCDANGSADPTVSTVIYGGNSNIEITPKPGYMLDTVKTVIGETETDVYANIDDTNDTFLVLPLTNIQDDVTVKVTFKQIDTAKFDKISWNSKDAVRTDIKGEWFVFAKDAEVTFNAPSVDGIRVASSQGQVIGVKTENSISISNKFNTDRAIEKIQLYYGYAWHDVENSAFSVYFDTDAPKAEIAFDEPPVTGYYTEDFNITVNASDKMNNEDLYYSGIKSIVCKIECNDKTTETKLYECAENTFVDAVQGVTHTVRIADYDSAEVKITIFVEDNAGNVTSSENTVKTAATDPTVSVSVSGSMENGAVEKWYNAARTATITIVDRSDLFTAEIGTAGIMMTKGEYKSVSWESKENVHTGTILFDKESEYEWSYSYTNAASRSAKDISVSGSDPWQFGIDTSAPTGTIKAEVNNTDSTWNDLLEKLTFNLFTNEKFKISVQNTADNLSEVHEVVYYISNSDAVLAESALIKLFDDGKFVADIKDWQDNISADEQFAVYARIADKAGNAKYIGTNGVIYDVTNCVISFDVKDLPNENNLYGIGQVRDYTDFSEKFSIAQGIRIDVNIKDANADSDFYAGIKTVDYEVKMNGVTMQPKANLFTFAAENPTKKELVREYSDSIIVDAAKCNSSGVVLYVYVTDNAGNTTTQTYQLHEINLDAMQATVTFDAPKAVTLDKNDENDENGYGWYDATRTATVAIVDRDTSFDSTAATDALKIIAKDLKGNTVADADAGITVSEWTKKDGKYQATVTFAGDAAYTWSIEYTNKAGNVLAQDAIDYGTSESPKAFTVDKTDPTAKITIGTYSWQDILLSVLTFGIYSNKNFDVSVDAEDATSPYTVEYYKYSGTTALDATALDSLYEAGKFGAEKPETMNPQRFTLYIRVCDNAGNKIYVSSDGHIIDKTKATLELQLLTEKGDDEIHNISEVEDFTDEAGIAQGIAIAVSAKDDAENAAGIQKIEYTVEAVLEGETKTTQEGTLYQFDYVRDNGANDEKVNTNGGSLTITDINEENPDVSNGQVPSYDKLCKEWAGTIYVDAARNNSCSVLVTVVVTDNAGNTSTEEFTLDIDITAPTVEVSYDNNTAKNDKYFDTQRVATLVYTERADHFSKEDAENGIVITAKDSKNNEVTEAYTLTWSEDLSDKNPDENTFTATITYAKDANYTFSVAYTDKAGNKGTVDVGDSTAANDFAVDTTDPTGEVHVNDHMWSKFLNVLTFGLYNGTGATVTATADDATSPFIIEYYKYNGDKALTVDELSKLTFDSYHELSIGAAEQFVVYIKITDYAGHIVYINSDGYIVDTKNSSLTLTVDDKKEIYGIAEVDDFLVNGKRIRGVKVEVNVAEEAENYSGIREIRYKIEADLNKTMTTTQEGVLYSFDYTRDKGETGNKDNTNGGSLNITDVNGDVETKNGNVPQKEDLKTSWNGSILVDADLNNSSDVKLTVYVTDNAGNTAEATETFDFNMTVPTISVSYDNNTAENEKYFDKQRTATVTVYDRTQHFRQKKAEDGIVITAKGVNKDDDVADAYTVEFIGTTENATNCDLDAHVFEITYAKSANYTFDISYVSESGNETDGVTFAEGSVAPSEFTVDLQKPTAKITVNERIWTKLLEIITFGIYTNKQADVKIEADDTTSPVTIEYCLVSNPVALTIDELAKQDFFEYKGPITINKSKQFVVYAKVTDKAGNYDFFNTDGHIVDHDNADIQIAPVEPSENGLYNKDIEVAISVKDALTEEDLATQAYSGIQKIEYWVVAGDTETARKTLYSFNYTRDEGENSNSGSYTIVDWASGEEVIETASGKVPAKEILKSEWNGTITIPANEANNSCNVTVFVAVTDNAGNCSDASKTLDIDITAPTIDVEYTGTANPAAVEGYYTSRIAKVTITERTHHFSAKDATDGIVITAKDASGNAPVDKDGNVVETTYKISEWKTVENSDPDLAMHTATVTFLTDANYTFDIAYTDLAGNEAVSFSDAFTIDTTAPTGSVIATTDIATDEPSRTWYDVVDTLYFGFWAKDTMTVTRTADDVTSPIQPVQYYAPTAAAAETLLDDDALSQVTGWKDFAVTEDGPKLELKANQKTVVYVKITDNAGNISYISTNGLIVDDTAPTVDRAAPVITAEPISNCINGIFTEDVQVKITVSDPVINESFSGLKHVYYKVYDKTLPEDKQLTQQGDIFKFDEANIATAPLVQKIGDKDEYIVTIKTKDENGKTINNSNNIQLIVYAEDNALNTSDSGSATHGAYCMIKIDTTNPIINVKYEDSGVQNERYYNANRKAIIDIYERNFDPTLVTIKIENTDGVIPAVVGWSSTSGSNPNGDDNKHTATITYSADGDYTFAISVTDAAGRQNDASRIFYTGTNPTDFTIDKTAPVIKVAYDNVSARNGNYYKAPRTATITVTEHNFSAQDTIVSVKATDDGKTVTAPTHSAWNSSGYDKNTASIRYPGDAKYTFDIGVTDLAGNVAADYTEETFFVDKTAPTLEITGVENESANNGTVIPVVKYSDTNIDNSAVKITLVGANRGNVKLLGSYADIHNGKVFTFADFAHEQEIDDIYTLSASLTDKAGNTTAKSIQFSVNRFGSTYALDEASAAQNKNYVQTSSDIVVTETNPDALENIKITLFKNNQTVVLKEGTDYDMSVSGGDGKWYRYVYTIAKSNFAEDGVYRLSLHSEDAAGNVAENTLDTKEFEINFGVDATLPTIHVNNLESGETYAVETLSVLMSIADNLRLSKVRVVLDEKEIATWTGDELDAIIEEGGNFSFDIAGDSTEAHTVQIIATDAAGNEYTEEITDFYVTTNLWVRYYTNKPLFFGSIAGTVVLAGLFIFLVVWKRRKKEEEKDAA